MEPENTFLETKDLARETFLVKWPNWVRWILFIPAALTVPLLLFIFLNLMQTRFLDIGPNAFYLVLMRGLIYGGGFVFVGSLVAPKHQKAVSIILLILLSIFAGMGILSSVMVGVTFASIAESLIMLAAGGYATYYIFQEG